MAPARLADLIDNLGAALAARLTFCSTACGLRPNTLLQKTCIRLSAQLFGGSPRDAVCAERVHPVASAVAFQAGPGRVTALATKERRRDVRRTNQFRGKSSLLLPAIEALVLLAGRRRP